MTSKDCLLRALNDLGFSSSQMRVSEEARQLEGYQGDKRADTAEIILPRQFVGGASNDIGFKLQEDGTWGAIVSDYDRGNHCSRKNEMTKHTKGYGDLWLKKLQQRYTYHKVKDQLSSQGFSIQEEHEENGEIYLRADTGAWG